ncbi:MAG: cation diffusion facilitator family transporter [Azoarcus sp.]|jgi:cation diffusion facilitator family transporter|nr:cation diffusion facilitator family transporter [Azoarcus sp.]
MSPLASDGESAARARAIRRVTLVAIAANSALALGQVAVGFFAHAFSLVADAAHTLSDLVTDFMVLAAGRHGADPADLDHPYGHGRIETAASLLLGASLAAVGIGFLWTSGIRLQHMDAQTPLHPAALAMALFTLAAKETLSRFTLAAGRRLRARLLEANAWHARSDAASSLAVAIGIGGSLAGYPFLEPLAAAVVGFLILRMGIRLGWDAVRELIDTGLPSEELARLRQTIAETPGVAGLHELRTRRMAQRVLCDAHVQVDPRITVSEGHYISDSVVAAIRAAHPDVSEALVHIDIEDDTQDDGQAASGGERLPPRAAVIAELAALVGENRGDSENTRNTGVPPFQRLQLHYFDRHIEAEVYFAPDARPADPEALKRRTDAWLAAHPHYRKIVYHILLAP